MDSGPSAADDAVDLPPRPFYVWIICIYFSLYGAFAIVLTLMLLTGILATNEDLTAGDVMFTALYRTVSVLYVLGGVQLFRYRKMGFTAFFAALLLLAGTHVLYYFSTGQGFDSDQVIYYLPDLLILAATTIYTGTLVRSGYLR